MIVYLVKHDLTYFKEYNEMMAEWIASNTRIAPWFLDKPIETIESFSTFVRMLDDCEYGRLDKKFCSTTSYFVVDENCVSNPADSTEIINRYWINNL